MSWFAGQTVRACNPYCAVSHDELSQIALTLCITGKHEIHTHHCKTLDQTAHSTDHMNSDRCQS